MLHVKVSMDSARTNHQSPLLSVPAAIPGASIKVTDIKTTSVTVSWDEPTTGGFTTCEIKDGSTVLKTVNKGTKTASLTSLVPGKIYTLTFETVIDTMRSVGSTKTFYTSK
jgi:hypothetical protein